MNVTPDAVLESKKPVLLFTTTQLADYVVKTINSFSGKETLKTIERSGILSIQSIDEVMISGLLFNHYSIRLKPGQEVTVYYLHMLIKQMTVKVSYKNINIYISLLSSNFTTTDKFHCKVVLIKKPKQRFIARIFNFLFKS